MVVSKEIKTKSIPVGEREDGSTWHVVFQIGNKVEQFPQPTAVSIIAPFDEGKVLAVKTPRGWGIPSGHIESEETWEETVKRELREETCAESSSFSLHGAMISNFYAAETSILIVKAPIDRLSPFKPEFEATERRLVTPEELIDLYYGNKEIIKGILAVSKIDNQQ